MVLRVSIAQVDYILWAASFEEAESFEEAVCYLWDFFYVNLSVVAVLAGAIARS